MKKLKKMVSVSLAVVLSLSMIGCGSDSIETTPSDAPATTEAASTTATETTAKEEVVMWGSWEGTQVDQLNQQIASYNESQDKYEVKYVVQQNVEEKLLTAVVGGDLPDVILWDRYLTTLYASKGVLAPLDELVARDNVDMSAFYSEAVKEMTVDGKLYGIPMLVDSRVIFYNKDLLAAEGIDPASIKTWEDLANAAVKLTKWEGDNLVQSGFSLQDPGLFNIYMYQAGGKLVSDDQQTVAYNSPEGLAVLNYWDKLLNELKVYQQGFGDTGDGFAAGKIAMTYNGPWALADYDKVEGLNYGVIEPPAGPNGDKGAVMGGFGLVIPANAKNPEGAWDFIKWWTTVPENGVEFAKISGWLPANKIAASDEYFANNEYYSVFVDTMEFAKIRPTVSGYSEVEGLALTPQLERFMSGEATAEEALAQAEEEGNMILEQQRQNND